MNRLRIDAKKLDFGLSVSCGQVFRFKFIDNEWRGVIAGRGYRARQAGDGWDITFEESEPEFHKTFDLLGQREGAWERIRAADPSMEGLIGAGSGLAMIQQNDPIEVIFSFLCSANNHVRRIEQMVAHLALYGLPTNSEVLSGASAFPTLEVLAAIDEQSLRAAGFGYRAGRIPACAREILERGGLPYIASLRMVSSPDALKELESLPGVGPKLAECIALFGLGHGDVFPLDTHMVNVVRRRYMAALGPSLTPKRRQEIREAMRDRFGADAGRAHHLLFVDELLHWRRRRKD